MDDDDGIREFITMTLLDEGYSVATAADGLAALGEVARQHPRLILLDMRMPNMDGWEFMRRYRELPGPHAPVIVLTAAREAARSAAEINADAFLAKPFELEDLLGLIERYTCI